MKLRRSRQRRRGRIEIIPMIDVMFFLLATFILASLSFQYLHSLPVNLPRGKTTPMHTKTPVTLTITRDNAIFLDGKPVTLDTIPANLAQMLNNGDKQVIVAADSAASHGTVTQAMIRARSAGVEHFIIAVKYND